MKMPRSARATVIMTAFALAASSLTGCMYAGSMQIMKPFDGYYSPSCATSQYYGLDSRKSCESVATIPLPQANLPLIGPKFVPSYSNSSPYGDGRCASDGYTQTRYVAPNPWLLDRNGVSPVGPFHMLTHVTGPHYANIDYNNGIIVSSGQRPVYRYKCTVTFSPIQ